MKKVLAVLVSLLLLCGMVPLGAISVAAAPPNSGTAGNCTWKIYSDGHLIINGEGEMGDFVFANLLPWNNGVTTVTIGDGITVMGAYALADCCDLEAVWLPLSLSDVGEYAFYDCPALTDVYYSGSEADRANITFGDGNDALLNATWHYNYVPITSGTTGDCTWTLDGTHLTISGNGAMGDYDYWNDVTTPWDNHITSVTIEEGVTTIGKSAFAECYGLTSVIIPNGVTGIGVDAFKYCVNLSNVSIPDSVVTIGEYAFCGCSNLMSVNIPNGLTTIGECAFASCEALTKMIIPNSVTSIGAGAFTSCTNLSSVTISESITVIEPQAFSHCFNLNSVTIPDSVTSIGGSAFYGCSALQSIIIPNNVTTIGNYAFDWCSDLSSITIPTSLTTIGDYAFSICSSLTDVYYAGSRADRESITIGDKNGSLLDATWHYNYASESTYATGTTGDCTWTLDDNGHLTISGKGRMDNYDSGSGYAAPWGTAITSVTIDDGVTAIGMYAFYKCTSLASVTIPDSVYTIRDNAFRDCTSLTSVTIPDSVSTIWDGAFRGCTSLTSVTIPNGVDSIKDRVFYGCASLSSVTIGDSVTTIGEDAFCHCSSLESVNIPDGVTTIENWVFAHCDSLASVSIPDSVTTIGDWAFAYCNSLASVTIPDSVTTIGDYAFNECTSLVSVTIGDGVTTIGNWVFDRCASLESVNIPDSVTAIGDYVFYFCESLSSVTIPDSVITIGVWAFAYCTSLELVSIPDSVTTIGEGAFANCGSLTTVTIPDTVTAIGDRAFCNCSSLLSVTIPDSVTTIGESMFLYCTSLESVIIPNSVTMIEDSVFYKCYSLSSIAIPDSVTTIGEDAFYDCTSLSSATIGDSVTAIGEDAFYGCNALASIDVDENNPNYCDVDGVLFNKEKTTLIQCPGGKSGAYTIPDSATTIGEDAFYGCEFLTSVTIGNSVITIDNSAFWFCVSLGTVTMGDSVTTIDNDAFCACIGLKTIRLPLSLTEVGDNAFVNCYSLTDVYYPGSEEDRANIHFGNSNDALLNATWHYNFTGCLHIYSSIADPDCDLCGEVRVIPTIEAGVETMVNIRKNGEMVDFVFVPQETGNYRFGSYGDGDTYGYILDANGYEIASNDDGGEGTQFAVQATLTAGETYILRARYLGEEQTGSFPVRVECHSIVGVTINDMEIIEHTNGYEEWFGFYYNLDNLRLTITYGDGTQETDYCYNYDLGINFYELQSETPWTVGNTYAFTATVLGFEVPFAVSIVSHPIASIVMDPLVYIEETHGHWEEGGWDEFGAWVDQPYYHYEIDYDRLTLTVTMLDGNVFSGRWHDVQYELDTYFHGDQNSWGGSHNQSIDNPWGIGDHTYSIDWLNQWVDIPVTIVESPIAGIEAESVTHIVGNGEWHSNWDEYDNYVEWMYYPLYPDGITVTLKDGTVLTGSIWEVENALGVSVQLESDQAYDNQWGVGDHTATVSIGTVTAEYTVSVLDTPIVSIAVEDITLMPYTDGYHNGDHFIYYVDSYRLDVTITFADGSVSNETSGEIYGTWYSVIVNTPSQDEGPWLPGNTYTATASVMGVTTTFNVTIAPPIITSIELEDISIIENTRGYEENGRFFYSGVYAQGTVTYADGTTDTFYSDLVIDGNWYYVNTNASSLQQEESWTVGNTYTVTGTIMGVSDTFAVTIVPSPVESFVVRDLVLYECFDSESESEGWDRYYASAYLEQVLFTDGTLGEIDYYGDLYYEGEYYYVESNCWDLQYEEHWQPGNTYTATATLMGVTSTFNITILPNPVKEIYFSKMPDKTTYLVGEALDLKGAVLSVVYNDGTYEDIAFDTHFAGGYSLDLHLEKIDRDIWFYQNIWFAEAGRQNAAVEMADYTCNVPVLVQENLMESLSVREDADKNIILTAHNSDGTTTDMKVLDVPYIWPTDMNEYYGSLLTDKGCYLARIFVGEDTFAIGLYITQEDEELGIGTELYIESDPIVGGDWFRVMQKMLTSNWYSFPGDYSIAYNREVTAENVDAVAALAIYKTSIQWDYVNYVDDHFVFDADVVRAALLDVFGLSNVDLSLSQYYDAEKNTFMIYDWIRSGGEVSFDLPSNVYYADGLWHVTAHAFGDTVKVWFDDNFQIVAVGIHADIPTVEPVVPAAKPGDANGDGRINNRDLGILQQYLSDWDVTLDAEVMDLNNDGRVNNRDLGILQQYLSDWDVELK